MLTPSDDTNQSKCTHYDLDSLPIKPQPQLSSPPLFHSQTLTSLSLSTLAPAPTPTPSPILDLMAEEFQERDIIFADKDHHGNSAYTDDSDDDDCHRHHNSRVMRNAKSKKKSKKDMIVNSLPVNIPQTIFRCVDSGDNSEEDEEMVPPHVIVGRRIAGKMAFSVCTGNGRTLKGRDLSQVRNSILRMTGFLET